MTTKINTTALKALLEKEIKERDVFVAMVAALGDVQNLEREVQDLKYQKQDAQAQLQSVQDRITKEAGQAKDVLGKAEDKAKKMLEDAEKNVKSLYDDYKADFERDAEIARKKLASELKSAQDRLTSLLDQEAKLNVACATLAKERLDKTQELVVLDAELTKKQKALDELTAKAKKLLG